MNFKLKEAFAKATNDGREVNKKELAAILWPSSREATQQVNLSNLISGRTTKVTVKQIINACNYLGCDANYITGYGS